MFNGRNYQPKRAFIKNGANIMIISDKETFNLQQQPNMHEFDRFRKTHPNNQFIIYPVEETIKLEKPSRKRSSNLYQTTLDQPLRRAWTFSGNPNNWEIALTNTKWGVQMSSRKIWNLIQPNDTVLFYVTRPVSRIIGYAKVKKIVEESDILWPDEIQETRVKYPLRIHLDALRYLPKESWSRGLKPIGISISHGINLIDNESRWKNTVNKLKQLLAN